MNINRKPIKNWWRAVWRGLVVDADGKHYRVMHTSIWLFIYLVIHADRESGILRRHYETIAADMQVTSRTIRRWLKILQKGNYVSIERAAGRGLVIHIKRWKTSAPVYHNRT